MLFYLITVLQNHVFGVIIKQSLLIERKFLTKHTIIISLFLILLLPVVLASAQVIPHAGTRFTFGIPEGPDSVPDPSLASSVLSVNILSKFDGKGIITSPTGYCQEFTFTSNTVTTVTLPFSFMHLKDIGKTNKGILIRTSQPANIVFHDFLPDAGEATQIYADEALGTDYRITTWGIANDPPGNFAQEDNHSQFIITATEDNTDVTIVPSVQALDNHPAGVPFQTTLNRGECYIVKADINSVPADVSLTNSTVISSKPVSIISAVSCGYVPLEAQACNEILDEILPRKITDTIFYVAPLRADASVQNTVLFTSDFPNFSVKQTNGSFFTATNGILVLQISKPQMFTVTKPAQCYEFSDGADVQFGIGDPSMVTVLPRSQYVDTAFWFTPDFISYGSAFDHYVSVIYPTASESSVLFDGSPIASISNPRLITSSAFSGTVATIRPGVHTITSPVPIFAICAGFTSADSYSFIAGTTSSKLTVDTIPTPLSITTSQAKTCRTFDATVTASFHKPDAISSAAIALTYDPSILTLVSVKLGPTAQGGQWITDASIPGKILISASCLKPFTDSGAIAILTFAAGPSLTSTLVTGKISEMGGEGIYGAFLGAAVKKIDILEIRDTIKAAFSLDAGHTRFTELDTATVRITSVPSEAVNEIDLFVAYNHDLLLLQNADLKNTILAGKIPNAPIKIDQVTDEIRIPILPPMTFVSPGIVARLIFKTFVSDSTSANITIHGVLGNSRPCPLDILADQVSSEFSGNDTCGYRELRSILRNEPFKINSIIPNPSNGSFTLNINRHLFGGDALHISLINMLGNEIWDTDYTSGSINQIISCSLPHSVTNGAYFLRVSSDGHTETQKVIIRN